MNLAMKRKLWTMRQELGLKKWFVVIDTDTFVDWDNLLELLVHHDAGDRVYMGSPVWLPKMTFAHGGSAYVLSYGALEALNSPTGSPDPMGSLHSQYGLNTTALCCGDEALARVLKPKGVSLKGYWPMFNGEIPATLSFGRDLWCEPVVSLHHLSGNEMQDLWQWYEDWKSNHSVSVSCHKTITWAHQYTGSVSVQRPVSICRSSHSQCTRGLGKHTGRHEDLPKGKDVS